MHFFKVLSWRQWSFTDLDGNGSLMLAMFAVILLWLVFDRMPLTVKYK